MNRKTWSGVLGILLVLTAAGGVPQALELVRAMGGRLSHGALPFDGWHALLAASLLLGLGAFLLAVRGALSWFEERGARGGVMALAREGRSMRDIARELRLSQDAVRLLLRPEVGGTRSRP
jgi:hypothetical protein